MKVAIEGMHCQACVQRVRKALEKVTQVQDIQIGSAVVSGDAASAPAVLEALRRAGYEARLSE